jgi:hypothetical protein
MGPPSTQDSSPFKSKFTVLKFNGKSPKPIPGRSTNPKYKSSGILSADTTPEKRGLFSNASNFTPI